ncbi:winged helix-turn-helix domain-containing protein [Entomohabitans teleogrylli]|uniref:winged helix-turn-helix domain-containing protein n=1 Tax=Entomohabitans teleogrylli TaxID=1384589 RepID=UPI00073DB4A8|nr:winged helix-turn-helix domain-containing protein [Entomohabitans teleogrylli]
MKYILDKTVTYRTEDGALWHEADHENKVILTATASRLLWVLIEHHGRVVTREFLLEKVWDNFGLEPSNNSLTQYISLIRRALLRLGLPEDTIQTRPKVGFTLNENVSIECISPRTTAENLYDEPTPSGDESAAPEEEKNSTSHPSGISVTRVFKMLSFTSQGIILCSALIFLAFILHLSVSFILHDRLEIGLKKETFYIGDIGDIGSCPVYATRDYQENRGRALNITRNILKASELNCYANTVFYLHLQERVLYGEAGKVFLSACQTSEDNLLSCKDFYDNEWN